MINIYTTENNNPVTSCIIYAKSITDFNLQNNLDVTALHLAEHCAFKGNQIAENHRYKDAYQFGKGSLEGKITKQWIGFIFTFYAQFYQEAIIWFNQFINQIQIESTIQDFNNRKKELKQELGDLSSVYKKCSAIRKKIFYNSPYKLSSGGQLELINKVTASQIESYKKKLSLNGQYFLSHPKSNKFDNFQQFKILNYSEASTSNTPKVELITNNYSDSSSRVFILSAMPSQQKLFLLGILDYFRNSYDCFDLECEISLFSNISALYLIKSNIDREFKLLIEFLHDSKAVEKAKDFALSSIQEDLGFIQSSAEDIVLDWVNGQIQSKFNFDELLTELKKVLKVTKC